uniref:Putative ovule protein n=1 Tax=Solanum chacoense TaxID=4108 RepID=A0A0V0HSZ9_SOLCH
MIGHLLYADDTTIFCEPREDQIRFLKTILLFFEASSGLKVNWGKSNLFPIKEVTNILNLADILGCKVENMPTVYLDMPLENEHKSIQIWDGIVEKTERRLARWKAQYLSMGGRHTLINSVLDSLPTYVMSLFPLPPKVLKKLDKLRRDFLWHGCKEIKGYNLVKWEITLKSKDKGGMGIRDLRKQNNSLLMKWLWRTEV